MQSDLFIPKSRTKVITWVKEIQLVVMEIRKSKPSQICSTIERIKEHHENHTSHYVWPRVCFWISLVILGMNSSWICGNLKKIANKSYMQERKIKWHVLNHTKECNKKFIKNTKCSWISSCLLDLVKTSSLFNSDIKNVIGFWKEIKYIWLFLGLMF
jgi:hypothetical protein